MDGVRLEVLSRSLQLRIEESELPSARSFIRYTSLVTIDFYLY